MVFACYSMGINPKGRLGDMSLEQNGQSHPPLSIQLLLLALCWPDSPHLLLLPQLLVLLQESQKGSPLTIDERIEKPGHRPFPRLATPSCLSE